MAYLPRVQWIPSWMTSILYLCCNVNCQQLVLQKRNCWTCATHGPVLRSCRTCATHGHDSQSPTLSLLHDLGAWLPHRQIGKLITFLRDNSEVFAWDPSGLSKVPREVIEYHPAVCAGQDFTQQTLKLHSKVIVYVATYCNLFLKLYPLWGELIFDLGGK